MNEIVIDMCKWWLAISAGCLALIILYVICENVDKEDKFLKKILGKRFYDFLNKIL